VLVVGVGKLYADSRIQQSHLPPGFQTQIGADLRNRWRPGRSHALLHARVEHAVYSMWHAARRMLRVACCASHAAHRRTCTSTSSPRAADAPTSSGAPPLFGRTVTNTWTRHQSARTLTDGLGCTGRSG
jgi:hypothetical protein